MNRLWLTRQVNGRSPEIFVGRKSLIKWTLRQVNVLRANRLFWVIALCLLPPHFKIVEQTASAGEEIRIFGRITSREVVVPNATVNIIAIHDREDGKIGWTFLNQWTEETNEHGIYEVKVDGSLLSRVDRIDVFVSAAELVDARRRIHRSKLDLSSSSLEMPTLSLEPGVLRQGLCIDALGNPVRGGLVCCVSKGPDSGEVVYMHRYTDDQGSFEFWSPEESVAEAIIYSDGFAPTRCVIQPGKQARIPLERAIPLKGKLVDGDGDGLGGVLVVAAEVIDQYESRPLRTIEVGVLTDSDGYFSMEPMLGRLEVSTRTLLMSFASLPILYSRAPAVPVNAKRVGHDGENGYPPIKLKALPTVVLAGAVFGLEGEPLRDHEVAVSRQTENSITHEWRCPVFCGVIREFHEITMPSLSTDPGKTAVTESSKPAPWDVVCWPEARLDPGDCPPRDSLTC